MPTSHPRVNVVLEKPLFQSLTRLAKSAGTSLSLKARDLIRDAIELQEDLFWEKKAEARARTFSRRKALSHKTVWSKLS